MTALRPYTPELPADLRAAFDASPVIRRARFIHNRLRAAVALPTWQAERARTLRLRIDALLADAEREWPIHTGPAPHLSALGHFLAERARQVRVIEQALDALEQVAA